MGINYCKLTEDLYPLYLDGLTSEESRLFIEEHLKICDTCRKKLDITDIALSPPAINSMDFQTDKGKYEEAKRFTQKFRKRLRNSMFLVFILFLMVGSASFYLGKQNSGETPIEVTSATDYAQRFVPGWNRAEKAGLIQPLDITKPIPGTSATVTFDKVWYTKRYTFVLYTVEDPKGQYYLANDGILDRTSPIEANNPSMATFINRYGGISDKGLHQVLVFGGYNTPVPKNELTLMIPEWVQGPFPPKDNEQSKFSSEVSVTLPLNDEYLKESLETVPLNQQMNYKDRIITLDQLEVGLSETKLYGKIALKPGEKNPIVSGFLKLGDQEVWLNYFEASKPTNEPNTYTFIATTDPLNEWPAKIELYIKELRFKTSTSVNFPFDWNKYKNATDNVTLPQDEQISQKFYDGELQLWEVEGKSQRGVTFKVIEPESQNHPIIFDSRDLNKDNLEVINENGGLGEVDQTWGGNIFGNHQEGYGFSIDVDTAFWKESSKVTIKIVNPHALMQINETIFLTNTSE